MKAITIYILYNIASPVDNYFLNHESNSNIYLYNIASPMDNYCLNHESNDNKYLYNIASPMDNYSLNHESDNIIFKTCLTKKDTENVLRTKQITSQF